MLTTITGKQYGFFYHHKPEYRELEKLIALCETGMPREVLAQIKSSGFDNTLLKHTFLIREAGPIPVHPTRHPFTAACQRQNYPVVRLLLELGMDVDMSWNYSRQKTHRQLCEDDSTLMDLFKGGKCWWKVEYPEAKNQELQNELERHVQNGNASEATWLMMHGIRLPSPVILANESFGKQPQTFKELICHMGIPENNVTYFHSWLKKNASEADAMDILDAMPQGGEDEGHEISEKLLLSINLLPEDMLDSLADRTFSIPARIGLLKSLVGAYDASERKCFIEKCIAALFREILCACWEI